MKILIICPFGLGDGIIASAIVNYYRKKYYNYEMTIVGTQLVLDLFKFLPEVKKFVVINKTSSIKYWFRFYKRFRGEHFHRIVSFRQSLIIYFASLVNRNIKVLPLKIGNFTKETHIVKLHKALIDDGETSLEKPFLYSDDKITKNLKIERDLVIINPNGSWYGKCWPASNFVEFIQKIFNNPDLSQIKFGIIGTKKDSNAIKLCKLLSKIDNNKRVKNLIGKYSLLETQELLLRSKLAISNDTAIMHLTAINNVPLIALWGPTNYNCFSPVNFYNNPNIQSIGYSKNYRKFLKEVYFDRKMCNINNYMSHISSNEVYDKFVEIVSRIGDHRKQQLQNNIEV